MSTPPANSLPTPDMTRYRISPGNAPRWVEYVRQDETSVGGPKLVGPVLVLKCDYEFGQNEPQICHELNDPIPGDWLGCAYVGVNTGRLWAMCVLLPPDPFSMKLRIQSLFQIVRKETTRDSSRKNYALVQEALGLDTFAYPGHWLLPIMFPK